MTENYKIMWLGFNEAPNHNGVWGHIHMHDNRDYVFWGFVGQEENANDQTAIILRFTKTLLFKKHSDHSYKIPFIISQKEKKGFKKIHPDHFEMICPKFKEDLEIWLMAHILQEE